MNSLCTTFWVIACAALAFHSTSYGESVGLDSYIPSYNINSNSQISSKKNSRFTSVHLPHDYGELTTKGDGSNYTIIDYDYKNILKKSNDQIERLYSLSTPYSINNTIEFLENINIPYIFSGAIGEGECHDKKACFHIKQDLQYRLDGLDCMTLVQDLLALINSSSLIEFQKKLVDINYGAYYENDYISYLNRNNFTSSDFNSVNQRNGLLTDVTNTSPFDRSYKTIERNINHKVWFEYQSIAQSLKSSVRVLAKYIKYADKTADLFSNHYAEGFPLINVNLDYIPKSILVKHVAGNYIPNNNIINKIKVPSVIEFVRDDSKWIISGKTIDNLIGSHIIVSHIGVLYKKYFSKGDLIYQKTTCDYDDKNQKVCIVRPVYCNHDKCDETILLAASNAYPNGYVYSYNNYNKSYACTDPDKIPSGNIPLKNKVTGSEMTCNRVLSMPLGDYMTSKQYGKYPFMDSPSLIGINIQQINS